MLPRRSVRVSDSLSPTVLTNARLTMHGHTMHLRDVNADHSRLVSTPCCILPGPGEQNNVYLLPA